MAHYDDVPPCSLTILTGEKPEDRFDFQQQEVSLGRVLDNDLVLYDPAVSRHHLIVYYKGGQFIAEDLGSSNGSLLNGQPMHQPMLLSEGDLLDVGSVRFHFSSPALQEESPTEIDASEMAYQIQPLQQSMDIPNPISLAQPPVGHEPIVRMRGSESQVMPIPPMGNTRQFSAHQWRQQDPVEQQSYNPNQVSFAPQQAPPQASAIQQAPLRSGIAPAPIRSTSGQPQAVSGIRPPTHPPPQAAFPKKAPVSAPRRQIQQSQIQAAPIQQAQQSQIQAAPLQQAQQSQIQAAPLQQAQQPQLQAAPNQIAPAAPHSDSKRPAPRGSARSALRLDVRQLQKERKQIQRVTVWSFVALLAAILMFILSTPRHHATQSSEPILITQKTYKKMYGFNGKDRSHPYKTAFRFFNQTGRVQLTYRIFSPNPIDLFINGKLFRKLNASAKQWSYRRHSLPYRMLLPQQFNKLLFKRLITAGKKLPAWGLTHVSVQVIPLPPPDREKAEKAYKKAMLYYKKRTRKAHFRFWALNYFQRCQDHLALLEPIPRLSEQAGQKSALIQRELNAIFVQKMQNARSLSVEEATKIYKMLLRAIPDKSDPRHQKVWQLLNK